MSEPLHEEQCFTCWLRACGVDPLLAGALMKGSYLAGVASALGMIGVPPHLVSSIARPPLTVVTVNAIEEYVRGALAAPPSPEVAAAMGHRHVGD